MTGRNKLCQHTVALAGGCVFQRDDGVQKRTVSRYDERPNNAGNYVEKWCTTIRERSRRYTVRNENAKPRTGVFCVRTHFVWNITTRQKRRRRRSKPIFRLRVDARRRDTRLVTRVHLNARRAVSIDFNCPGSRPDSLCFFSVSNWSRRTVHLVSRAVPYRSTTTTTTTCNERAKPFSIRKPAPRSTAAPTNGVRPPNESVRRGIRVI